MTAITPLLSGQYYSLSGNSSAADGSAAAQPQPVDPTDSLLQALAAQSSSQDPQNSQDQSNSLFGSDLVDLSPQAQDYLNGLGLSSTGGSSLTGAGGGFALTPAQQKQISDILAKYKDAPFTQDTYDQIQNDLKAAGLSPDQLSLEDKIRSFDPTQVLIDALNGTNDNSNLLTSQDMTGEQPKSDSYMQGIVSQWRSISTTAAAADGSASGTDSGSSSNSGTAPAV